MTLFSILLIISIIASGLFSGLMLTLIVIMQRIWREKTVDGYIADMQTFLPAAKGDPIVTVLTIAPIILPIIALIDLGGNTTDPRFALTLIGALAAVGPLVVTLRFNFPIYEAIMSWQPTAEPENWQEMRERFFYLNIVRFTLMTAATVCFLMSLGGNHC